MAIIESTGGTAMAVDAGFAAARVSVRPPESLAWLSLGAQSSSLTGMVANALLFSFRNLSANPVLIRRVGVGFITTTAFTTAQMLSYGLFVARGFTASDSGGTAIALTGSNAKHRTAMGTLSSVDCRITAGAALSAGTRTLDANTIAQQAGWSGGQGVTIAPALSNMVLHDAEDYPVVLAQNEGFVITNLTAMGATGAGVLFVQAEIAEASAF